MAIRRVGIYGGTFDPVHNGHLEVARQVLQVFALDEVIFVPACVPPHKRTANITSAFHRFAMLALATEADQRLLVSTAELDAPDRPYAVNTVERMRAAFGPEAELFFVVGADSWLEIKSWLEWERLLTLTNFIVMTRPGYELDGEAHAHLPRAYDVRGQNCENLDMMSMPNSRPCAFITDAVQLDISAVEIRAAIQANDFLRVKEMMPASVSAYIEKHGLYKN